MGDGGGRDTQEGEDIWMQAKSPQLCPALCDPLDQNPSAVYQHVYIQLIHVVVLQKATQCHRAIKLQLKKFFKKEKKILR